MGATANFTGWFNQHCHHGVCGALCTGPRCSLQLLSLVLVLSGQVLKDFYWTDGQQFDFPIPLWTSPNGLLEDGTIPAGTRTAITLSAGWGKCPCARQQGVPMGMAQGAPNVIGYPVCALSSCPAWQDCSLRTGVQCRSAWLGAPPCTPQLPLPLRDAHREAPRNTAGKGSGAFSPDVWAPVHAVMLTLPHPDRLPYIHDWMQDPQHCCWDTAIQ